MKASEWKVKIEKKQETLAKKAGTIEKKNGWIAKKEEEMKTATEQEQRWIAFEIRELKADIDRLNKEIAKGERQLEEWQEKMKAEEQKEKEWEDVPECLKEFEQDLIQRWTAWDLEMKEAFKKARREAYDNEIDREAFYRNTRNHPGRRLEYYTDEQIRKDNEKSARKLVQNLITRVRKYTGTINDWTGLSVENGNTYEGAVITGFVKGEEGKAEVETILAGGYNIQRLHVRTLVHKR